MSLPTGRSRYTFSDPRPGSPREITVHTYRPASSTRASPIVIVIAGRNRNADDYRDFWVADADRRGLLLVAPEFNEAQYPHPQAYNYCAMVNEDGTSAPKDEWIFPVIECIF